MKDIYYLNKSELPTIPMPHDCIVKDIKLDGDYLVLHFDDNTTCRDFTKIYAPSARSFLLRFHLLWDINDVSLYIRGKNRRLFHKPGAYRETDAKKLKKAFLNLAKFRPAYLYHYVGYCSIIIKLWSQRGIVLDISADYVEFEWMI